MLVLASALVLPAQGSFSQSAAPELSNIPQPHLGRARAGENRPVFGGFLPFAVVPAKIILRGKGPLTCPRCF